MNLRSILHRFRRLDAWLIGPAMLVVIYGELAHSKLIETLEADVWDKLLHFTAYFGLAAMATIAVRADRRSLLWALGLVVMGGLLEIVQGYTGRDPDIFDEMANTLGVIVGTGMAWTGIAILKRRGLLS